MKRHGEKLTINLTNTDFTVARARARLLLRPWEHAHLAKESTL